MDKIPFCSQLSDYHSDDYEEEEIKSVCFICRDFNNDGQFLKSLKIDNKISYAHSECVEKTGCAKCTGISGDFCIKNSDLVHVNDECSSEICYFCNFIIGDCKTKTIDGLKLLCHKSCVHNREVCYVCGIPNKKLSYNDPLIYEGSGIRHSKCNPIRCTSCKEMFIRSNFRTMFDGIYHDKCGPKCRICDKITDHDTYSIVFDKEFQYYRHKDCLAEPCFICDKDLGNSDSYFKPNKQIQFRIHKNCAFKCRGCNLHFPDIERLKLTGVIDMNYRQFASDKAKDTCSGIYFLQKAKFIQRTDGYKLYMPKDVCEIIIREILNNSSPTKEYLDNCPTRKRGINMELTCTRHRCCKVRCSYCSSTMSWSKDNFTGCREYSCGKIRFAFKQILKLVFNYTGEQTRLTSNWPFDMKTGFKFVTKMFIDRCDTLSEKQISLYNALLLNLRVIMVETYG